MSQYSPEITRHMPGNASICIYVFETVRDEDRTAERSIADIICPLFNLLPVHYVKYVFKNVQELASVWDDMCNCMQYYEKNIIHWVSHGNVDGVYLGDGNKLEWGMFKELLKVIPDEGRNTLYLNLCSCEGAGASVIGDDAHAIYYAHLIGANRTIRWNEAAIAYSNLYFGMFSFNVEISKLVKLMNISVFSNQENEPFIYKHGAFQSTMARLTEMARGRRLADTLLRYVTSQREVIDRSMH